MGLLERLKFMSVLLISVVVLLGLLALVVIFVVAQYNGLVKFRERYRNGFAQIDVQLKRRHDLIPNLIETAKGFMKHERETLEAVIVARSAATDARAGANVDDANSVNAMAQAEGGLGSILGKLFALSESYPDLKSNQNMMQLSEELSATENKVSFARQAYNDAVTTYNVKCESFPSNILANMMGFKKAVLFEVADAEERKRVDVSFD